jgi:hypothetical protein
MARLALFAPPAATIMVIPMIYNLLHRHPSCVQLIHRTTVGGVGEDSSAEHAVSMLNMAGKAGACGRRCLERDDRRR